MDKKIEYLAKCRQIEAEYQAGVAEAEAELRETRLWSWLEQRREYLAVAKVDVKDAEADVRKAALAVYTENGDTAPHQTVRIKLFTVLEYDDSEAHAYARQNFPHALKLDKRAFEKVAKVIEPDFVTITKQPRATIARDLSEWLVGEMES